jgi:hypothetical protein
MICPQSKSVPPRAKRARRDQNNGYAYGDAPGFQMHLVPVSGGGFADTGPNYFFAQPTGAGAIFNLVTGPRNMPVSGPLEFVSLNGSRTAQFPTATIPVPVSTPFSPNGKLMLVLCTDGQCVLNAHTDAVVGRYRYVGYDGQREYPAQNAGWYDNQHFLSWLGVGPGHYALAVVNLSGLVTGIILRARYRGRLPHSLDDLAGPDHGTVQLPLHVAWSGQTAFDLDRPKPCMHMYRIVLTYYGL